MWIFYFALRSSRTHHFHQASSSGTGGRLGVPVRLRLAESARGLRVWVGLGEPGPGPGQRASDQLSLSWSDIRAASYKVTPSQASTTSSWQCRTEKMWGKTALDPKSMGLWKSKPSPESGIMPRRGACQWVRVRLGVPAYETWSCSSCCTVTLPFSISSETVGPGPLN